MSKYWYALLGCSLVLACSYSYAARESNIAQSKHNLSVNAPGTNTVRATDAEDTEICVFCHTPHEANTSIGGPLWNRSASGLPYQAYTSSSLDAGVLDAPGGSSKLCLTCHDGTVAIGAVNNKAGPGGYDSAWNRTDPIPMSEVTMPSGTEGFERLLGRDLKNDHPISVQFDSNLAALDGELETPAGLKQETVSGGETIVGARGVPGLLSKPLLPLEKKGGPGSALTDGEIQCGTCHDPHIIEPDSNKSLDVSIKFLRLNRFQLSDPVGGSFNKEEDIVCLACHKKEGWVDSAHANSTIADELYEGGVGSPAELREFPDNLPVYKASCLNCHDTHTESYAERLLREGASSNKSAVEETCYQCHSNAADSIVTGAGVSVPNIKDEFLLRAITMPISELDQRAAAPYPAHQIENADFDEAASKLGKGILNNRHAECPDCHNPHRVIRNSRFSQFDPLGNPNLRTHDATSNLTSDGSNDGNEGNVASGALRGTWGIEPVHSGGAWLTDPDVTDIKRGDPGSSIDTSTSSTFLTREYQLCFKCHSNFSLDSTNMPDLTGNSSGTQSPVANHMSNFTNVAAEFASVVATNPPTSGGDQGELNGSGIEPSSLNHRSWHPVMFPTGRNAAERTGGTFGNIRAPFADFPGTQTMHCSDCHGADGSWDTGIGPNSNTQGPHGSNSDFLVKGVTWNPTTATPNNAGFCSNCHNPTVVRAQSGFDGNTEAHHQYEDKDGARCGYCHIAVPHGWKNKAFLVNLNCIQTNLQDASGGSCTSVANGSLDSNSGWTSGPYYVNAKLKITSWTESGNWGASNCNGVDWMQDRCGSW
jgi:predicted CXXCH cytochrome family protein